MRAFFERLVSVRTLAFGVVGGVVLAGLAACSGGGCTGCTAPAYNPPPAGVAVVVHPPTPTPVGATPSPVPTPTPFGATPSPVPTPTPVGATPTPAPTPITTLSCAQNAISGSSIPIGSDSTFAILAGSTVTNAGPTTVNGNIGLYPGTAVVGFSAGNGVDNGTTYIDDPAGVALAAQSDLTTAFNLAAGRAVTSTLSVADIGGLTIAAGVYKAPVSLAITGTVTLDAQNNPNAVFIFQIPTSLTVATNGSVVLINGARACNVFWEVGSSATLNANTTFDGNILAYASISVLTGATVNGRLLAQNAAVSLLSDTVSAPGP